jgi:hypothetical protein
MQCCREVKDSQGRKMGVAGSLEELADRSLSSQPLCAFDWSPDKAGLFCCGSLDQCIRVGVLTSISSVLQ